MVCALAVLFGACGQTPAQKTAKGPTSATSIDPANNVRYGPLGPAPIIDTTGSPSSNPYAKVTLPPPVRKKPECPGNSVSGAPGVQPTGTYISAAVDSFAPWTYKGSYCPQLASGNDCWVPFRGSWRMTESPSGSIVFQAFENDSATPVRSPELGPVPSAGSFNETTRFHYVPSKNARSVTFRVLLRDLTGRVVAQSDPETLPIPGCGQR